MHSGGWRCEHFESRFYFSNRVGKNHLIRNLLLCPALGCWVLHHGLLYLQDGKLLDVVYLRREKRYILIIQSNDFVLLWICDVFANRKKNYAELSEEWYDLEINRPDISWYSWKTDITKFKSIKFVPEYLRLNILCQNGIMIDDRDQKCSQNFHIGSDTDFSKWTDNDFI